MEYNPITMEQLIPEEAWDEQYHLYRPAIPLRIFHSVLEPDEDSENCSIGVSVTYSLQQMLPTIQLNWILQNTRLLMTGYVDNGMDCRDLYVFQYPYVNSGIVAFLLRKFA